MKTLYKSYKIVAIILCILPLMFLITLAFSTVWRFPAVIPSQWGLQNLHTLTSADNGLVHSAATSLLISFSVSFFAGISAFLITKYIAYHRSKQLLVFFAYLPFVLSPVIYAACLNYFFVAAGLSATIAGVLLAQFIIIFPYNIILFLAHWNQRMLSYQQLSATLGAGPWQRYRKVILPLSKNILLIAFFQSFLISWFEFGLTNFIGSGQVKTLTVNVYQYIDAANIHLAALSGLLLIIPPLILLWLNKRFVFHTY